MLDAHEIVAVDVVSAAAYNTCSEWVDGQTYCTVMEQTIRNILRIAARGGNDGVVLGAIGCGVFRNRSWESMNLPCLQGPYAGARTIPELLCRIYAGVIREEFPGVFNFITFSVPAGDPEISEPFHRTFFPR